jgi:hypothetical protein
VRYRAEGVVKRHILFRDTHSLDEGHSLQPRVVLLILSPAYLYPSLGTDGIFENFFFLNKNKHFGGFQPRQVVDKVENLIQLWERNEIIFSAGLDRPTSN